jgi:hypothetical protein
LLLKTEKGFGVKRVALELSIFCVKGNKLNSKKVSCPNINYYCYLSSKEFFKGLSGEQFYFHPLQIIYVSRTYLEPN